MAKFVQGQTISTLALNNIDNIIQTLKANPTMTNLTELFKLWDNIPANTNDTNITDEIQAIQDKINSYLGK